MWCSAAVHLCLFFSFISSAVLGEYKVINVNIGGGFKIRLHKSDAPSETCQLTFKGQAVYNWIPGDNMTFTMSSGQLVHPMVYNDLDNYACGIHIFDVVEESRGLWTLDSIDQGGIIVSESALIKIQKLTKCPNESWNDCRLLSLDNYYLGPCNETFRANFSYKCDFIGDGQMSRQSIPLTGGGGTEIFTPHRRTETGITVFECPHTMDNLIACHIEHVPSKTKYFIKDGLLDPRYSGSYNGLGCHFEFLGEISEDETGTWIMSMEIINKQQKFPFGPFDFMPTTKTCKFHLKGNETLGLEKIASRTKTTIVVKTTNNTATIECAKNVFYPIRVCYLINQYGEVRFSQDYDLLAGGSCEFDVYGGTWKCGFNGPNEEDEDFLQNFKVIQREKLVSGLGPQMTDEGSMTIGCHLFHRNPIKVCMLVSPRGKVYRPTTDKFRSEEFSYYNGGSMRAGMCGITISKDAAVESGYWSCLVVKMNDEKLTTQIDKQFN